ncbi:hypothetical protein SAMN05216219_1486 [Mycetocola miduiensis]|uniref:Uncharacterized protein n=1 Tax=Mycetocola miduiensis TaxID=995034 RepID=A0A1I5AI63_9MICO|nr:hypothetical protein SAMN05216219_1486 [Mycetocola miduiensis]
MDTTYFFARSIVYTNGFCPSSIQAGHVPMAGFRHADSIIP